MENKEKNNEIIIKNEGIQIILKAFLYDKFNKFLGLFTKNGKFDKESFDSFLNYLNKNIKKKGFFIYNNDDFKKGNIDPKIWIENIKDILEMSNKEIEKLNIKEKKIVKLEIEKYIMNKIDNLGNLETQMELINIFKN